LLKSFTLKKYLFWNPSNPIYFLESSEVHWFSTVTDSFIHDFFFSKTDKKCDLFVPLWKKNSILKLNMKQTKWILYFSALQMFLTHFFETQFKLFSLRLKQLLVCGKLLLAMSAVLIRYLIECFNLLTGKGWA